MTNVPIAKRLKETRLAAKISQKKLGIASGIDQFAASARMNQYEKGKHTPDYLTLKRIAYVVEVPVAYYYAEDDDLAELIASYGTLSKSDKRKFLKHIKNAIKK